MNMLAHFDEFTKNSLASGVSPELRRRAFDYLSEHGLPTRKNEDWKYTSLQILNEESFLPGATVAGPLSEKTQLAIKAKLSPDFINLVFHNGIFNSTLSSPWSEIPGLVLKTVSSSESSGGEFQDSFAALNAAFRTSHYQLSIAAETSIAKPIQLIFYSSAEADSTLMVHPHISVRVGAGSSVAIMESYFGPIEARYFINPQVTVKAGNSANLVFVRLQADGANAVNIGRTSFDLASFANLHSLVFSTGARLSRHNLDLELKCEGISALVDGVYLVRDQQHVDNATLIHHVVGGCNTSQHYKGILADRARAVFNGKVKIAKGAQKANSAQLNNNLLLSRLAEADSKPQLEVHADDVKASHGSTVGQLNREELFYLESRAISPEVAIPMLSFGYASELIYKIENPALQSWLNSQLQEAFAGLTIGAV
jgi:Fe-S cluster assembly protein SufD